ncbi:hypothetical protein AB0B12_26240 [Streptomyces sp. NPDC044780]|uniref:hypothetical protein n=1 Tax=unclassified Streptomyces TaxID=2593676 RepID=UPI0033FFC218
MAILLSTAGASNSGTDDQVRLQIRRTDGAMLVDFETVNTPQEDLETGSSNWYFTEASTQFTKAELDANSIRLSINGEDAWRPSRFFAFGFDTRGDSERPRAIVPLVSLAEWPFQVMSTDTSEGVQSVTLPLA